MSRYLNHNEIEDITLNLKPKTLVQILYVLVALFIMAIICRSALAAQVTLQWDPNEPAPTGYRLFQRLGGQNYDYTTPVWEGDETTAVLEGLEPGKQYYFVVRAFVDTNESGDSNEVGYLPDIAPPANLRINMEFSVYIDINGVPVIAQRQIQDDKEVLPVQ